MPLFAYFNALRLLIYYRDALSSEEFISFFGFNTFFFLILFISVFIGSIIFFRSFKQLIIDLKLSGTWTSYFQTYAILQPILFFIAYSRFFLSSIFFIDYFVFGNEKSFGFAIYELMTGIFVICIFFLIVYGANKYKKYEFLKIEKIEYSNIRNFIESVLQNYQLKYKNMGSRKELSMRADDVYLINNDFEILINCPFKDSKFFLFKNAGTTTIYIGAITNENRELILNIQKEIDTLKKNI